MYYEKGSIVQKKNIIFKGTNKIDFRINGHPIIFPVDFGFDDEFFYFFTISSQIHHYPKDPDRYFLLKKKPGTGLKTPSIVDLKYVYKCESFNCIPIGSIPESVNAAMISKFRNYHDLHIDQDCKELLSILEVSKV